MRKGRSVRRYQYCVLATDSDATLWVASMLHVLRGCSSLNNLATHAARETDASAINIGPGGLEQLEYFGVIEKINAHLFQKLIRVVLNELQALFTENFNVRNLSLDVRCCRRS